MTPADAAKLLELPDHATPDQIEARFLELRRKLEDKIAKAPTPGLQAKYRESLNEITQAFETLTLAADSSSLPVLQRQSGKGEAPRAEGAATPPRGSDSGLRSQVTGLPPKKAKSGGKEFAIVALIAVIVLGVGGWFVMKTRAENAEKARIAAEAKAEADRQAEVKRQAEAAEKVRAEQVKVQLRTVLAEAKIAWDVAEREERDAERRSNDLRSELRSLREAKPEQRAELERRAESAQRYSAWLRDYLLRHPLKVARAKLEETVQAGAAKDAEADGAEVRRLAQALQTELGFHSAGEAALNIETNLPTAAWELTGPGGFSQRGVGRARVTGLLFADYKLVFSHPTFFEDLEHSVSLDPGREGRAEQVFDYFRVTLKGLNPGDRVEVDTKVVRPLADGTFASAKAVPGGNYWVVNRDEHLPFGTQLLGRDDDAELEIVPVPLQPRALADAYLAALADKRPRERVSGLNSLLQVTAADRVIPLEERHRLLRELREAIEAEPLPPAALMNVEGSLRAGALFQVASLQVLTDRAAALETARAALKLLADDLPRWPKEVLAASTSGWVWAAFPDLARDYAGLLRSALAAEPGELNARSSPGAANLVYSIYSLLEDAAAAAEWRTQLLAQRPPESRTTTEAELDRAANSLTTLREALPLRSALVAGNTAEFNRLAANGAGEQAFANLLVADLLAHGYEQEAIALAASSNGTFMGTLSNHALVHGRIALLEDYVGRMRRKDSRAQLQVAEAYAIAGNLTKARALVAKIDPTQYKDDRLITLVQLKDFAAARVLFDDIEKNNPVSPDAAHLERLPTLVSAARLMGDTDRVQRLLDLTGAKEFVLPIEILAQIGAPREEIMDRAWKSPIRSTNWAEFYLSLALRAGTSNDLPLIRPGSYLPLVYQHLAAGNRPLRNRAALTVPYARQTLPTMREGVYVPYPEAMRQAGISGYVEIMISVDASGQATGYTTIAAPHPAFAEAMYKAASEKGFFPPLALGKPVAGHYKMTRNFKL